MPRKKPKTKWNLIVAEEMKKLKGKGMKKGALFKTAVKNAKKRYGPSQKDKRRAARRKKSPKPTKIKSGFKKALQRSKDMQPRARIPRAPDRGPIIKAGPIIKGPKQSLEEGVQQEFEVVGFDLAREREEKASELPLRKTPTQNVNQNVPQPTQPKQNYRRGRDDPNQSNQLPKRPKIPKLSSKTENFFKPINKQQYSAPQPKIRNIPQKKLASLGKLPGMPPRVVLKGKTKIDFEVPSSDKIAGQTRAQKMLSISQIKRYKPPIPEDKINPIFDADTRPLGIEDFADGWQMEDYLRQILNQNNRLENSIPIENLDYQDGSHININPSGEFVSEADNFEFHWPDPIIAANTRGRPIDVLDPAQQRIFQSEPERVQFETYRPKHVVAVQDADDTTFKVEYPKQYVSTNKPQLRSTFQPSFPHQKVIVQDVPEVSTYRDPIYGTLPEWMHPYAPDREAEEAMARFQMGNPFASQRERIAEEQERIEREHLMQQEMKGPDLPPKVQRPEYGIDPFPLRRRKGPMAALKEYEKQEWIKRYGIPDISQPDVELFDEPETMEDLRQGFQPRQAPAPAGCKLAPQQRKRKRPAPQRPEPQPTGPPPPKRQRQSKPPPSGTESDILQQLKKSRARRRKHRKRPSIEPEPKPKPKEVQQEKRKNVKIRELKISKDRPPLRAKRRLTKRTRPEVEQQGYF